MSINDVEPVKGMILAVQTEKGLDQFSACKICSDALEEDGYDNDRVLTFLRGRGDATDETMLIVQQELRNLFGDKTTDQLLSSLFLLPEVRKFATMAYDVSGDQKQRFFARAAAWNQLYFLPPCDGDRDALEAYLNTLDTIFYISVAKQRTERLQEMLLPDSAVTNDVRVDQRNLAWDAINHIPQKNEEHTRLYALLTTVDIALWISVAEERLAAFHDTFIFPRVGYPGERRAILSLASDAICELPSAHPERVRLEAELLEAKELCDQFPGDSGED